MAESLFSTIFLFAAVLEDSGNKRSVGAHCALGTEFLTAEAPYTFLPLYHSLALHYDDCLCRTDLAAQITADAILSLKLWL